MRNLSFIKNEKYSHMKNNLAKATLFIFLLGFILPGIAQEKILDKANANYKSLDFVDAQKIYLAVAKKGYISEELFEKLGNTYYFNAQYDSAAEWYKKLFELSPSPKQDILLLRYSQALKATGNNQEAAKYYNLYVAQSGSDPNSKKAIDYMALVDQNSKRYQLRPLDALYNADQISFGQTKIGNKLVYASTEETHTKNVWDGLSFLSLYEIELNEENIATGKQHKLSGKLNSKFHDSSPIFTKDGNTMYFTRNNLTYKNRKNNQNLKIYKTIKDGDSWQKPEELHFNSDLYSSAHPALSPDETKLYFTSDRPGGFGESDLYVATITDGVIGNPVNLGTNINTAGKETFPFVSGKNELYFSSNGHFGLGGLDVFYVKIEDNAYGNLLNIGAPINSYADDFSFGVDVNTKRGFISSNRSQTGAGFVYDNIYSFLETEPIIDVYQSKIDGYVTDKQSGMPLANTTIILTNPEGKVYTQFNTDKEGHYEVTTNKFEVYSLKAKKEEYDTDEKVSKTNMESQQIDFQLQPNKVGIEAGMDLAKVLNIPMIYFDYNQSNIRPSAQVELEKIYAALNEYPQLKLTIRSHTDSRGNNTYNKTLSESRAKSTLEYLTSKGIDKNRLKSEGLGESELVNNCKDGVDCSEAEHQKNRRSEFIIID